MNTALAARLDIYFESRLVGFIYDTAPLSFEYAPGWVASQAFQIANIALQPGRNAEPSVSTFFENLLPEGELRDYLFSAKQASTLFGLLRAVAGDTAGGFVLLQSGRTLPTQSYRATSWAALAEELQSKAASAITLKSRGRRISLAGAQEKLSLTLFADGIPRLGLGVSPSTHLLKPDIQRFDGVWASAVNETLIMQAASGCGLQAARVFFEPTTRACVVQRFDRYTHTPGTIGRILQYDLCQLSSLPSGKKYEAEGGPSLYDCAALVRKYSTVPATDLRRLLAWVFFNLFTGNNDSHAKNLSIYSPPGGGVRLTPFYDLMCTRLYPGLGQNFAFNIGGTTRPGEVERQHIVALAQALNMRPAFVLRMGHELAQQLPGVLRQCAQSLQPLLKPAEAVLTQRLVNYVNKTTRQAAKRMQLGS